MLVKSPYIKYLVGTLFAILPQTFAYPVVSNSKHDPFPPFRTTPPYDFLDRYYKEHKKGLVSEDICEYFSIAVSVFGQNASIGKNKFKEEAELGDLEGKWSMVGLLYGPLPDGATLPPTLEQARSILFPTIPSGTPISDPFGIDKEQKCGFFSVPTCYRKRGIRFESALRICDVYMSVSAGIADICHTVQEFNNLTSITTDDTSSEEEESCHPLNPNFTENNINQYLMCLLKPITKEIGLDISNFHEVSAEDIHGSIYWKHVFSVNKERDTWPEFLIIPFIGLEGSVAVGQKRNYREKFALSFGSNDFDSISFASGINLDFVETIEIGCEAGITHFFPRDVSNVFVPTSEFQSGIYPFSTDVHIFPGNNWHFSATLTAYHFIDRLSFHFQYAIIHHEDDCISLIKPDEAFVPQCLEQLSTWKSQVANVGFNYNPSPHINLGFLWQVPLSQQNSFKSTTLMFSFQATY